MAGRPQRRVGASQLLELLPPAALVRGRVGAEEIVGADRDQQRLGRHRPEHVPPVERERAGADQILLGIVGRARREERTDRDVLRIAGADGCRGEPLVHRGQNHRQRAAARLARRCQAARVYLRVRGQDIEAPHRVPQQCARGGFAGQQHLPAGNVMLLGDGAQACQPPVGTRVVGALALPDGVEREHDVAELHQPLAAALIERVALSAVAVPHLEEDAWIGRSARLGQVEIRRDEPGPDGSRTRSSQRGTRFAPARPQYAD